MMVAVESARSAAYYAACVAADDADELPQVASTAKAVASAAYFRCAADAIQIHGGVGMTWEYDTHLYFKRAKSTETFLGAPSWHRERVAGIIGL
jgi:alkylation response protein AidB-like acyl-CoA dehydrogenase